ncbi:hypothetical protein RFI_00377 [Reticulomyxa filosa]|uniref:Reverse transcriptase domain-containing protein n=1 Tax=Reticulomyxa filosa TaxID=46433 RepID=X6PDU8_RETFI|nr:hypothetical protein RFI_00377 [Reticulomyxa filosa]|eukprot:ETO36685.1 hypothetical protein RFI_00377 [Reticulomyxa filosa]
MGITEEEIIEALRYISSHKLLSGVGKLLERIITMRLMWYLNENKLLHQCQEECIGGWIASSKIELDKSNERNFEVGVPQGSSLSPMLFLLYINDKTVEDPIQCGMFADDVALWTSIYTSDEKEMEWQLNQLQKSLDNTQSITFKMKNKKKYPKMKLKLDCSNIEEADYVKYLGSNNISTMFMAKQQRNIYCIPQLSGHPGMEQQTKTRRDSKSGNVQILGVRHSECNLTDSTIGITKTTRRIKTLSQMYSMDDGVSIVEKQSRYIHAAEVMQPDKYPHSNMLPMQIAKLPHSNKSPFEKWKDPNVKSKQFDKHWKKFNPSIKMKE